MPAPTSSSRSFGPGTSAADIQRFVEGALSDETVSPEGIAAAVGSATAALRASNGDGRIDVTLEIRGDDIHVRVGRAGAKGSRQVSFAEWLKKAIKRQGMSQEAAARAIGVSLKTVNRWARGETEPRYRELGMIWDAFGEGPPLPLRARRSTTPERRRQDSNL
jgi:DNA-binding XRE family transcriptional regulator